MKSMIAEIISVGDELLIGATVNTNAAFMGQKLTEQGVEVRWISTVGDDSDRLFSALDTAVKRADVILLTGGLGPTHDDMTRNEVARFFRRPLVFQPDIYRQLEHYFHSRKWVLSPLNRKQAEIPRDAEVLRNSVGTAPGFYLKTDRVHCFVLPGVPREMKKMMTESVLPRLIQFLPETGYLSKSLHTIGISESVLNEKFKSFGSDFPEVQLASLPNSEGVSLRLSVMTNEDSLKNRFHQALRFSREAAGRHIYGEDEERLETVVGQLLLKRKQTIAVAESCTGGLISHRLTNIPGSSAYFERAVVSYSNRSKMELLQVPESVLQEHGAVSAETALAMAEGILSLSKADIGLSVTGIAGPDGGSKEKPVGLVYIGYASREQKDVRRFIFSKDRLMNKARTAAYALNMVRLMLQDST